jgi:hypothetical protein
MFKSSFVVLAILIAVVVAKSPAQIRINEVCSSNDGYYFTHNHDDPDWIELYNTSDDTVNLSGWKIYDKDNYGKAFILPDTSLAPNGFLIVNCSDRNGFGEELQVIESSAPAFRLLNYDALDYFYLPFKGDVSFTCRFHNVDYYEPQSQVGIVFRTGLESDDPYASVVMKKIYEVIPAIHLRHFKRAWISHHTSIVEPNFPNARFRFERIKDSVYFYSQNEKNDWLLHWKLYYESPDSILAGIAIASNNPENTTTVAISDIEINGEKYDLTDFNYKNIYHDNNAKLFTSREINSNFKISDDDTILLWNAEGELADSISITNVRANNTLGRYPDGSDSMGIMAKPSPGRKNDQTFLGYLENATVDVKPGKYVGSQQVRIMNDHNEIDIYFTTDGTEPADTLEKYHGQIITIDSTSVLKVKMFKEGYISGATECFNYLINENTNLPVLTISSDIDNFFSPDHGIFNDLNLQRDIEIPAHFHYFDGKGNEYSSYMGIKAHGSTSKLTIPMKSMRLYARYRYGNGVFEFPFFDKYYTEHKRLVVRNAGQDWYYSYIRDAFVNLLSLKLDSSIAAAIQPCVVYLNGSYWGLMYLQERVDEKMISKQYNINDENINFFEDSDMVQHGEYDDLKAFTDTLNILDLSNEDDFEYVMSKIDLMNYCNYAALRFFSLIIDWPCLNEKFWQSDGFDDKYRWLIYDSDISCGFSGQDNNFKNFYPAQCLFSQSFIFLIKNKSFRTIFINHYCDLLNTFFHEDNTIKLLDSLVNLISPEIQRHQAKWQESCVDWEDHIEKVRDFLRNRSLRAYESIQGNLFVDDTISIRFVETGRGTYKINSIVIEDFDREYKYYRDIPVTITAIPDSGYYFKKWKTNHIPDSQSATFKLQPSHYEIEAEFFSEDEMENPIINEIMYRNSEQIESGDWFELYNPNPINISISEWTMKDDDDHIFTFSVGSFIEKKGYLVVSNDSAGFVNVYPEISNKTGYFDFGLGVDDMIRIYDRSGELVDSVNYSNIAPWDPNADQTGFSLELMSQTSDNSLPENWKAALRDLGTPGESNSWEITLYYEMKNSDRLIVSPNPARDRINIHTLNDSLIDIEILDIYGRVLLKKVANSGEDIDISDFASGTYLIIGLEGSRIYIIKFVVIR